MDDHIESVSEGTAGLLPARSAQRTRREGEDEERDDVRRATKGRLLVLSQATLRIVVTCELQA